VPTSLASAEEAARSQPQQAGRCFALSLPRLQLLALFFAALAIRLAAVMVLQPRLGGDGSGYIAWAQALVAGSPEALTGLRVEHAPLYGVLLAAGLLIPGVQITWFAVLVQALAGAATVVVLARLTARETASRTAGLCAGAIAVVQISFVFWTTYVVSETVFLLIVAIAADQVLLLRSSRNPARDGAIVGVLALLSIAARPTGAVLVLALLVVIATTARWNDRRLAILISSFCLPFALVVSVTSLGALVSGSSVPSGISGRVADWTRSAIENGLLWTESGRATIGVDLGVYPPPIIGTLPPDQRDEFLHAGPLTFAQRHPEFVVAQAARKLRMFWAPALPEYSLAHAVASSAYFLTFYALALAGFVLARRITSLTTLASLSVGLFTLASLITIVDYDQRYRLPVELFLMPMAGSGVAWLLSHRADQPPARSSDMCAAAH
jgi:4-amino-4-deoxy-L-arabinose transferase-like glycosyltransferase